MKRLHRNILIDLRKNIIQDVDVENDILQPLKDKSILEIKDITEIYDAETKEDRARNLLDILPRCGASAFDAFHQSLKHHYEWLSDEIDKLLDNCETETNGEIETSGETDYYAEPPNIPPLSPLTVTRERKVDQLKEALKQLLPAEYIALHGMKGYGKSCLVASTLKDVKLVKELFLNQVYWIKFTRDCLIDEEILIQLNTLYHNVRNLEILPESFTPLERNSLIQYLKHYFNKEDNSNALLILDDVYNKEIINTFDFKCKTLVLTADISVVKKKGPKIIKMNKGFTEAETLSLFAKVLEIDVNKLPMEAKSIHEECKGMPLLIAMFAAQFEEFKRDMRASPGRWRYYLKSLRKKDATNKVMKEFFEIQETIFDICIDELKTSDLKKRYESLAVFYEDVNITPKTLEIFWEQDIFQVEELMLDFCHKSLAAKKWNQNLKTYIYGVHDLLLFHLRKKQTDDELTQLHKTIIENYRKYCNNDFSKLPDDNYIYSYIGYHLEHAKMFEEFPRLYLNFDFIQAKLIHAGVNDLLLDLRKYRKYITLDYEDVEKNVSDLERFLQDQANIIVEHKCKKCLDIIQIAMNHPCQGYVAQTARNLAMTKRECLYLSHKKSFQYANMLSTEEISTGICTSSFTDDPDLMLFGNTSGKIIMWNSESKQQKVFSGHNEEYAIKKVIVSKAGDCFLSLCSAGIIKLFRLFNENGEMVDQHFIHTDSPRQKQRFWSDPFRNLDNQNDSLQEFSVKNEIILDMAFGYEDKYVAACTDKATIQIWNRDGRTVFTLKDCKYQYIPKIAFTAQGSLLHIMDESKGAFFLYSNCGNQQDNNITFRYLTCYNLQLKSAFEKVIFFHHIPNHDNSLMVVTETEAMHVKWWWGEDCVHSFNKQTRGFVDNDTVTYVCATITYDGEYVILADSAGFINVWDTYSGYRPVAIYKSRVMSLDSYWLRNEDYHIICGNGAGILYRWKFPKRKSDVLPRKCLFDAIVSCDKKDIVVKENASRKIIVSHGEDDVTECEGIEGKISNLQLSADGDNVLFVTNNNNIHLLNTRSGAIKLILSLDKPIQFVKMINLSECFPMVLCKWEDTNLKICQFNMIFGIDSKESINDIHRIYDDSVIIVTENGIITAWHVATSLWSRSSQVDLSDILNLPLYITISCLSHNKNYLAVLNKSHLLILLYMTYGEDSCVQISEQPCFTYNFAQKATCCDISKNERYIAVGFESGQISIIDIQKQTEITQLSFHANPVIQLHWISTAVDVPILLSLTSDELVWWNIALSNNRRIQKNTRRSRMGIQHSASTPSFSANALLNVQISNSRSVDTGVSNLQDDETSSAGSTDTVNSINSYWKNKVGKDPEIPELLAVVELPPNRDPKVCISPDFTRFVIADMYSSINTFELIDYDQSSSDIG